jgi:hypothetical protein
MSLLRIGPSSDPQGKAPAATLTEIREVGDTELDEIQEAIKVVRARARPYTVQLVRTAWTTFDQTVVRLHGPLPGTTARVISSEIEVALVTLLLMWRLFLDHTRHDLSQRFGKPSSEYEKFETATNTAYDDHAGYRLLEGLRNYVQHVGMPGLHATANRRVGKAGEPAVVTDVTIVLPRDRLLAYLRSSGGQRLLRQDLEQGTDPLPILDLLKDAMQAFEELVQVLIEIDSPKLMQSLRKIKSLFDEATPGMAALADFSNYTRNGGSLTLTRFDDLYEHFHLIEERTTP